MGQAAKKIFDTIPKEDICGLYDKGGVNHKKLLEIINFKNDDVGIATGVAKASVRFDSKMPAELKERLEEWAIAVNLVASYFKNSEKTIIWLKTPNPMFGGISPRDMIRLGRFKKLLKYIQSALDENIRD